MVQERRDTRDDKSLIRLNRDLCRVEGLPLGQRTNISSARGGGKAEPVGSGTPRKVGRLDSCSSWRFYSDPTCLLSEKEAAENSERGIGVGDVRKGEL